MRHVPGAGLQTLARASALHSGVMFNSEITKKKHRNADNVAINRL